MPAGAQWTDIHTGKAYDGGQIVACGTPEQIAACPESFTGQYLKKLLK